MTQDCKAIVVFMSLELAKCLNETLSMGDVLFYGGHPLGHQ